jgi:UDP-glucuronate decarboxylase
MNIGNPHEIPVRELAERVICLTGTRSHIVYGPLPQDDPTQRCPDITYARHTLAWEPRVGLDFGLQETVAYFRRILETSGVPTQPVDPVSRLG